MCACGGEEAPGVLHSDGLGPILDEADPTGVHGANRVIRPLPGARVPKRMQLRLVRSDVEEVATCS